MGANKLTDEQRQGLDGLEQFNLWMKLYPGDVAEVAKKKKLPPAVLRDHIEKLRGWLAKYRNSPKSHKRDWKRFLNNCLPDLSGVKSHGYRKSPGRFEGGSGQRDM